MIYEPFLGYVNEADKKVCGICVCRGLSNCECHARSLEHFKVNLNQMSEATICAEFYHECKRFGLSVRLEVSTPFGRLDALVFNGVDKPIAIVEVKRGKAFSRKQLERYQRLGLPVFKLWRIQDALPLASNIKQIALGGSVPTLS